MAFDVTNPTHLASLKNEQSTDPISMGYAAVEGHTRKTLALFNDPSLNVGGEMANVELTAGVLLDVMVPADLGAQQVDDGERRYIESLMNRGFDESIERWRSQIRNALRTNSATVTAIDALFQRISRAEVLFGKGPNINADDWFAARDS